MVNNHYILCSVLSISVESSEVLANAVIQYNLKYKTYSYFYHRSS